MNFLMDKYDFWQCIEDKILDFTQIILWYLNVSWHILLDHLKEDKVLMSEPETSHIRRHL